MTTRERTVRRPGPGAGEGERALVLYARWIGVVLAGYLMFDRAFAYLHLPGSPLFIGEMMLVLASVGVLGATGHLLGPVRDEPILALLGVFLVWGVVRAMPGLGTYGIDAVRDSALWYYSLFAFAAVAAAAAVPELPRRLVAGVGALTPWLLLWLPVAVLLVPLSDRAPVVPFSDVSVLSHKPGNAAIAALLVVVCMWLFPERHGARGRVAWSMLALVVIALAATQNRGGLLGVAAGAAVGLLFLRGRLRLMASAVLVTGVGLVLATLLPVSLPVQGVQGRDYSATQLVANVVSLGGQDSPGNLGGTVEGRQELWSKILAKQRADGRLVDGSGFGQNLAAEVGVYDEGKETLRNPHNSHLHVLARMGVIGLVLWAALWLGWYRRLVIRCRRLLRDGDDERGHIAVGCLSVTTAILVSSVFDPQLEGPQMAALLWTTFGIGVAVTSTRASLPWPTASAASPAAAPRAP